MVLVVRLKSTTYPLKGAKKKGMVKKNAFVKNEMPPLQKRLKR